MTDLKKEVRYSDWLIWISFVLMLIVKLFTLTIFSSIHVETGAEIEEVATAYEVNDVFKIAMSLGNIGTIIAMIILPASAMAYYYYIRRKVFKGKVDIDTLLFFVQFVFFALLINIVNDGAILLGKLV